jgi:hypothetical protein
VNNAYRYVVFNLQGAGFLGQQCDIGDVQQIPAACAEVKNFSDCGSDVVLDDASS